MPAAQPTSCGADGLRLSFARDTRYKCPASRIYTDIDTWINSLSQGYNIYPVWLKNIRSCRSHNDTVQVDYTADGCDESCGS
jgi:hypothetical protein